MQGMATNSRRAASVPCHTCRAFGTLGMKPERALIGLGTTPAWRFAKGLCATSNLLAWGSSWSRSCKQPISGSMTIHEQPSRIQATTPAACRPLHVFDNRLCKVHLLRTANSPHCLEVPQYQRAWRLHSVGLNCSTVRSRVAAP